jgi:hypothetical protein
MSATPVSRLDSSAQLSMTSDWGNGPNMKSLAATLSAPREVKARNCPAKLAALNAAP